MILVTGATGNIGGALTAMLVEAKQKVRVLARNVKKAETALGSGVEVVEGDLTRPETLPAAFAGTEKAFFVSGAGPDMRSVGGAFFDAAKSAGVKHVVAVSSGTVEFEPPVTIGKWHQAMEEQLQSTGLAWTLLRPGNFASNSLRWVNTIRAQSSVFAPHNGTSAPIDPRDIAAVAFEALTKSGHEGKTYALTGAELLTTREQVAIVGKTLGKEVRFVEVPEAAARNGMIGSGMPEQMVEAVMELMRAGTKSGDTFKTNTVQEVTGRQARSYEAWVRDHASLFA